MTFLRRQLGSEFKPYPLPGEQINAEGWVGTITLRTECARLSRLLKISIPLGEGLYRL